MMLVPRTAFSSKKYWRKRYKIGGNSGCGSYGLLAEFKADVLNSFVSRKNITSVIEFGCGDGNQLFLSNYPIYVGYDISAAAISMCRRKFSNDGSKRFELMKNYDGMQAHLCLSLDVIFHLVEDSVFESYMRTLFGASRDYVAIYSSNTNENHKNNNERHLKHRRFSDWIKSNKPEWYLIGFVGNKYPYNGDPTKTSFSDFYFYQCQSRTTRCTKKVSSHIIGA
jgi:SAM-dependent methyltransferase